MARIYTLIIALIISASSFAQISVTVQNTEICAGESTWLKASGMTLYAWSDSVNLDNYVGDSVNFSTTTPGIYSITALGYTVFPLDTDTVSVVIHVNANPSAAITSSAGGVICEGSSTELAAVAGYSSYLWTPSGFLNNDTSDTVIATPSSDTTVYLTVSDTNGCSAMDSISINVVTAPLVTISSTASASGNSICQGNSATLTAVSNGTLTYEWSPTGSLNNSTTASVIATPNSSTLYTLQVTDSASGCAATTTYQLNVSTTIPTITVALSDSIICLGDTADIALTTSATLFSWTPSGSVNNPTAKDVKVFPTTTTTYTVLVNRQGCTSSKQITIEVLGLPSISASQSSNGAPICLDEEDIITVNCPACVSYLWVFPNSTLATTGDTQVVSPNTVGANIISITGFNASGCGKSDQVTVNVDDCYIGTPFGIEDAVQNELTVKTATDAFEFVSDFKIESLNLYNLLGENIYSITGNRSNVLKVTTLDLSSGVYVATLVVNGKVLTEKLYVQ